MFREVWFSHPWTNSAWWAWWMTWSASSGLGRVPEQVWVTLSLELRSPLRSSKTFTGPTLYLGHVNELQRTLNKAGEEYMHPQPRPGYFWKEENGRWNQWAWHWSSAKFQNILTGKFLAPWKGSGNHRELRSHSAVPAQCHFTPWQVIS